MTLPPKAAAAAATILWGFTYILTTSMLPANPWFIAAVRALGGALPLLLLARETLPRAWWGRMVVLGTLNNGLFFGLLFVAAIRLPGGVAATFQALGPLFMVLLALPVLGAIPGRGKLAAVAAGAIGVSMVVLRGGAQLDVIGVLAALGAAFSVALGGTLVHKWGRPASIIGLAAWQMLIAGVELAVVAALLGDVPDRLTALNFAGLAIVALLITALPFVLWFTGIQGAGPSAVAPMLLLTPITAFVLDAVFRGMVPTPVQALGVAIVIASLLYGQHVDRKAFRIAHHHAPSPRQEAARKST
ncbi:DMT family transporter [Oceanicella sp. SM1341]|uniref:DMT family transporter n=1 Tax=Oceanicella sp. SM1341 TaxID=1548889 RepID=UPI000E496BCC|nr:DMT family transporter [Oceanicella sp. SM1341]